MCVAKSLATPIVHGMRSVECNPARPIAQKKLAKSYATRRVFRGRLKVGNDFLFQLPPGSRQ